MKTTFYYTIAAIFVSLMLVTLACVSETTDTDDEINSIAEIKQAAYREAVWDYQGKSKVISKVIEELKSSPDNKKQLEHSLLRRDVLWEEAMFLIIENKKRILVPFLSRGGENVVGALSLSRNAEGVTEWEMVTRWDLVRQNGVRLPFWTLRVWNGYFKAWDKDILKKDNGSPGMFIKKEDNQENQLKSGGSLAAKSMGWGCYDVYDGQNCVSVGTCVMWGDEGMLDCEEYEFEESVPRGIERNAIMLMMVVMVVILEEMVLEAVVPEALVVMEVNRGM